MKKFIATSVAVLMILCATTACGSKTTDGMTNDTNGPDNIPSNSSDMHQDTPNMSGNSSNERQNNNDNPQNDSNQNRIHGQIMN